LSGRRYGMHRSRARWPTRSVDHPTDTALPAATEPEDEPVPLRCTNRRAVGAFPGRRSACTAAALGGQRGVLTTLPIPRCLRLYRAGGRPKSATLHERRAVGIRHKKARRMAGSFVAKSLTAAAAAG